MIAEVGDYAYDPTASQRDRWVCLKTEFIGRQYVGTVRLYDKSDKIVSISSDGIAIIKGIRVPYGSKRSVEVTYTLPLERGTPPLPNIWTHRYEVKVEV